MEVRKQEEGRAIGGERERQRQRDRKTERDRERERERENDSIDRCHLMVNHTGQ